jgi:hypothetical protein
MSRHGGSFTGGVLSGALYLTSSLSFPALATGVSPPDFAPNPSVGWTWAAGPSASARFQRRVPRHRKAADLSHGRSQQSHPPALGERRSPQAQRA